MSNLDWFRGKHNIVLSIGVVLIILSACTVVPPADVVTVEKPVVKLSEKLLVDSQLAPRGIHALDHDIVFLFGCLLDV